MAGRTGYTPPSNAMQGRKQIEDVYKWFDPLIGESRANAAALPAAGNWIGRTILLIDTKRLAVCTALPGSWSFYGQLDDSGWVNLALAAGYGAGSGGAKLRRMNGIVQLAGSVTRTAGSIMATLPEGFRPATQQRYTANAQTGGLRTVVVEENGNVSTVEGGAYANLPVSGISFMLGGV